jgi:dinuclear metal center YbgI/SA1388 family protein
MTVGDLLKKLDEIAPPHLAFPNDPIGLQVGELSRAVQTCVVCLDVTPEVVEFAVSEKAQVIISHHAVIYHPMSQLTGDSLAVRVVSLAIKNDIALICAHTNWDAAPGGINDTLAEKLGLINIRSFGNDIQAKNLKLVTFIPENAAEKLLDALASVECGVIGLYRRCAFVSGGRGTFEPMEGANPLIGKVGEREVVDELRVEMLVPGHRKSDAVRVLYENHPYDEPAYDLYELANDVLFSLPRMGDLGGEIRFESFSVMVSEQLKSVVRTYGGADVLVKRVGVVGGAGGSYWERAMRAGCDVLVTGEVRHHEGVASASAGFCLLEAGHYATEQPGMFALHERLSEEMGEVRFVLFEANFCERG